MTALPVFFQDHQFPNPIYRARKENGALGLSRYRVLAKQRILEIVSLLKGLMGLLENLVPQSSF
jgi:hypothetical protein